MQTTRAKLVKRAQEAMQLAHAPYSDFPVGAAILTRAGEIFTGCNIEVSSYGLTICAERVAVFKALSEGVGDFEAIAVTTRSEAFCPPCGACRQVLFDFAPDIRVIMVNAQGEIQEKPISQLLPDAFGPSFLPGPNKNKHS